MSTRSVPGDRFARQPLSVRTLLAAVIAVGANVAVTAGANSGGLGAGLRALSIPSVVFLTTTGVVGGAVVYALLERRVRHPDRAFRRLAVAVLVASFVPIVALYVLDDAATLLAVLVLATMHVVTAAVCISIIPSGEDRRTATARERTEDADGPSRE